MSHTQEASPEPKQERKINRKKAVALAAISLVLASTVGCTAKAQNVDEPRKTPVAEASDNSEAKNELSASEQRYAEYLKTLSPEQVALRESLNPDALAEMTDAQMTEAFTIHTNEVTIDENLDPKLYAEAFTARMQASNNSGISEKEYAKWGGLDSFDTNDISEAANKYFGIQSQALFGYVGTDESVELMLGRGSGVDNIIKSNVAPLPKERYRFRITVNPNSIKQTENSDGSFDITFDVHMSDNWEKDTMYQQSSLDIDPTDSDSRWTLEGVHITQDGFVLPSQIDLNSKP